MKQNNVKLGQMRVALGLSMLMSSLLAQAQVQPNIGDAIRQVPTQPPVPRPEAPLPSVGGLKLEPPLRQLPQGGATVEVKKFELVGNREIDASELVAQLADAVGKSHTLPELEALASRLTRYYRTKGYFVARVYVPAQEVKDGVLVLRAVEGNYGKFILDNRSRVKDRIVQGMLDDVKKFDIVSLDTLERAMLIINDTPGAQVVRADVMPGDAVGTSDFAVGTVATPEHQGYVLADNYGSRYTGKERLSFNWDWNSPTGHGDRLSVSGLGAFNGDLLNGRIGYSTSLHPSGWRGEVALSQTTYTLGDAYANLDAQGVAQGFDVGVSYPIRRIRAQTIEFGLSYAMRDLTDEVRSTNSETDKQSSALTASLSLRDERSLLGFDGLTQAALRITHGDLDIRDAATRALDQAAGGARTHGDYTKLFASLSRVTLLPQDFTLTASLRHQHALGGKNLDGSERMGISGASGVLAYPMGEASGTDATLVGIELSRPLPSVLGLSHQWSIFTNWGQARTLKQNSLRDLSDIGIGWSARHANGLLIKTQLASRLSDPATSEPDRRARFLIQAGMVF